MKVLNYLQGLLLIAALSIGPAAYADVVTDWNTAALTAIRANNTPPPVASRVLAILHTSIYDAVNGIDRTHESYFVQSGVPAIASTEAAANSAAHRVLVTLFPSMLTASMVSTRRSWLPSQTDHERATGLFGVKQ